MLALSNTGLAKQLDDFRATQRDAVLQMKLPPQN
jgi:hypothetical protein